MVQLFPSANLDISPLSEGSYETMENGLMLVDSPKVVSSETIIQPLHHLSTSTIYHGYDAYIENGLICLKHKVRNLEKKKVRRWRRMVVEAELQPVTNCPPTAETRRLQEQAKEGRDPEPRSDGMELVKMLLTSVLVLVS